MMKAASKSGNSVNKPLALVQIDDLSRHVCSTLRRCPCRLGNSFIEMTGGLLRHCLRKHLAGQAAHPGNSKMAKMGNCSDRQARRNLRQLEAWSVLIPFSDKKGGRRATRYWLDLIALKRAMVLAGCNPSRELVEKIDAVSDLLRTDIRADMRPDMMSAGYSKDTPSAPAGNFRVVGGSDV
ncbi:hypothetical protein MWU53_10420 [Aliiroseovarius sp. S1123]|uniref:hypothetical protein n=1 Tax=Aliiroseovarius sp. S1123 TaxID=2926404 RepID=UPI001FF29B7B|nr:hypothetical protein [Aliiroseovarius sp. S1123]MCK0171472.1 hypothetical protein [Aliiroseovarius sp. S1123]